MIGILSIFAFLGVCLVITIIIATGTLSALRGFGSMQAHWTETRKEVTFQAVNYIRTADSRHIVRYDSAISILESAQKMRAELNDSDTDNAAVKQLMAQLHIPAEDQEIMIKTYERFHGFSYFRDAVDQWVRSDELISQVESVVDKAEEQMNAAGSLTETEQNQLIREVAGLDRQMTQVQYDLAAALGSGTQFLSRIILWIALSLGFILLLTGGLLSFRFLNSIKNWHHALAASEQKYRSLFEQNPNIVFSLNKEGHFTEGNRALLNLLGLSADELRGKGMNRLLESTEVKEVYSCFKRVLEGNPQKLETIGKNKEGGRTYLEITMLPIYVDDKITGAYVIGQDISERKKAEKKIKEQLEEKTYLLSEIHDRVKNNLALILSLMHLQLESLDKTDEAVFLDSTISRIHSIAMVHEQLYHTETFSKIDMAEYVRELSSSIQKDSDLDAERYKLQLHVEPITLSINEAIPTGLILNELLKNTFNYAFQDQDKGIIRIRLSRNKHRVILQVSDNGAGLHDNISLEEPDTLGFRLVRTLIAQLDADYTLDKQNGTTVTIRFTCKNEMAQSA